MHSDFKLTQSRSMKTLSIQRLRPSIEMRTPAACKTPVKRGEVNWLGEPFAAVTRLPPLTRPWATAQGGGVATTPLDGSTDTSRVYDTVKYKARKGGAMHKAAALLVE